MEGSPKDLQSYCILQSTAKNIEFFVLPHRHHSLLAAKVANNDDAAARTVHLEKVSTTLSRKLRRLTSLLRDRFIR